MNPHHMWKETRPHRLEDDQVPLARFLDDLSRFASIQREWLFHENMFASIQSQKRRLDVLGMRCRYIDDIDIGICDNFLVAAMSSSDLELLGESLRFV